ncbi:hypothetical protein BP6252_04036 [Coleophoma cylindrospora]|uniref:Uncharacterized protein n=1 Tax=Coleophoma cylindrospora TaxID=1849047 RepID=A0A3D8RZF5_9HELO|nr:hypothetical protein BP6252_04036 [Coleophoma cylindrospora]
MRLIDTRTGDLVSKTNPEPGSYAILSHTWGDEDEEVSFQNFGDPATARLKTGLAKIAGIIRIAQSLKLDYVWVDTCCIDKSSSAELSEAINSMFKWYQDSAICVVYLSDLPSRANFEDNFPRCRWLTRGWTLQELIAPKHVQFYTEAWEFCGDRSSRRDILSRVTGIDNEILENSEGLHQIPIARRMSWASSRHTTRVEDQAYCLLGIFGINMPMIYGEGPKAFMRLQEEIAKDSGDLSLFAWATPDDSSSKQDQSYRGIFATSPREFIIARGMKYRSAGIIIEKEFSVTNRGLKIETTLVEVPGISMDLVLNLGVSYRDDWPRASSQGWMGIYLTKTSNGLVRSNPTELYTAGPHLRYLHKSASSAFYIRKTVSLSESVELERRFTNAIHVAQVQSFRIQHAAPDHLWDPFRGIFLHQGMGINAYLQLVFHPQYGKYDGFQVIIACSTMGHNPVCALWMEGVNQWHKVRHFLEHRKEVSDYVAIDYLSSFVGGDTSVLSSSASTRFQDPATNNTVVFTVSVKDCWIEGRTPAYSLEASVTIISCNSDEPTSDAHEYRPTLQR